MAQKTTSQATETKTPWTGQTGYLTDAFQQAQNNFNNSTGNTYKGDIVAGLTPEQLSTFKSMVDYGGSSAVPGYSGAVANNAAGTAGNLAGTGSNYDATAGGLYGAANGLVGSGARTTAGGVNAMSSALRGLGGFTPTGGVDSNISAAGRYADNPAISGMVDAAMRDSTRAATEQALPGIARSSALTGNLGSSKRGIAEGVVTRGLNDQAGDISANLRGSAYNTGLGLSENARQFDNSAMLDAIKSRGALGGTVASTGLGQTGAGISAANAGTSAGGLGLGYNNAGLDASKLGLTANNMQLAQQAGLFDIANSGGAGLQSGNQLDLDAARSQIEYQNSQPWDALSKYYGIIGANNWGGTSNSSGTQSVTPSPLTLAASGMGAFGSLFGKNGFGMLQPAGQYLTGKFFG